MYKKFSAVINERDNDIDSFIGARDAPTSIILFFLFLIMNMSRHLMDPNKQTSRLGRSQRIENPSFLSSKDICFN